MKLTDELSRQFLAGLITGEGSFCFGVMKRRGKDGYRITPIFAMFMSDRDTIEYAADLLRNLGLPVHIQERPKAGVGQIGIHINGFKRVKRYCEELGPHLTGQKFRAALLVGQFIESREKHPSHNHPYTEHELDLVRMSRANNGNTRGRKNPL